MNELTATQRAFNNISPVWPEYARYRLQRAVNDDPSGNAKAIFEQTLSHLYRNHLVLESPKIVVCTGIAHDGLGDLMHAVHASTFLKNNLLSPHVSMICSMSNFEKGKNVVSGQILEAAHECMFAQNFDEDKELQTKAKKAIDTAEVVVKVATGSMMTELKGLSIFEVEHALYFSELGLGFCGRGLGLAPEDIGVQIPLASRAAILDDSDLSDLLVAHSNRPNYSFHLGYLKRYPSQNAFFSICCLAAKASDASVDIVMPMNDISSPGWTDADESEEVEFAWVLNQLGLKQISLYVRDSNNKLTYKQTRIFGETGLDVRIINSFPVSSSSFAFLSSQSELSTGCTGDFSFLETILGKRPQIPFYEIVGHESRFFSAFLEFLKGPLPEKSPLFPFFQSLLKLESNPPVKELFGIAKIMAHAVKTPEVLTQIKNLSSFIKKHFNFNEVLLDYVLRETAHVRFPMLKDLEDQLLRKFVEDPSSLEAAYKQLENTIIKTAKPTIPKQSEGSGICQGGALNFDQRSGAEAAKLKKFSDAGGSKYSGCSTQAETDSSGCFGIYPSGKINDGNDSTI